MKKYVQPSMEMIELQSEKLMDMLVTSTPTDPSKAFGNRYRWSNGFDN